MRLTARWKRLTGRPEQVLEVGFETGFGQDGDEGVEDVGDGAGDDWALRQRSRVRFVLEGTVAVELEFGRRRSVGDETCGGS